MMKKNLRSVVTTCAYATAILTGRVFAQDFTTPLPIPPLASGTHFDLTPDMAMHDFADTVANVNTLAYNVVVDGVPVLPQSTYLGPPLEWTVGDSMFINVHNPMMHATTVHWHGMHSPAMMDGGPHQEIAPMTTWQPYFKVLDAPATMWYHPHLHHMTYEQVSLGLAGLLRVTSPEDTLLPFHYGVDDVPLVVQDKLFRLDSNTMSYYIDTTFIDIDTPDSNYTVVPGFFGSTFIVNGVMAPVTTAPRQMVRYRMLDGAQGRSFYIGFTAGTDTAGTPVPFHVTAGDAGALDSAYVRTRVLINPGERWEINVDYGAFQVGDTVTMWTYAADMPQGIVGAPNSGPPGLVGVNKALMRVLVGPTTTATFPKMTIPAYLGPIDMITGPPDRTRKKTFYGAFPHHPSIDSIPYEFNVMNDTVLLNSTEEWTLINSSDVGHPFHIHDVHFFVTGSTNAMFSDPIYKAPKDVVIVPAYDTLTFITEFLDFADSIHPYMYHCHILAHEDQGMMHQWIVADGAWHLGVHEPTVNADRSVYPNPTDGRIMLRVLAGMPCAITINEPTGRTCRSYSVIATGQEVELDLSGLASGVYLVAWQQNGRKHTARVIKQ